MPNSEPEADNREADTRKGQAPADPANTFDKPLPGSDGSVPNPTASGFAEPIEAASESGAKPGSATDPKQKSKPGQE